VNTPWRKDGILDNSVVSKLLPPEELRNSKAYALLECVENIPCDPCTRACPFKAITMEHITDLPQINWDRCTGCALCVMACPGLAIFIIDETTDPAKVTVPYEMLPLPEVGEEVKLLSRRGEVIGKGKVLKLKVSKNKTYAVTVEVPRERVHDVRAIRCIK